MGSHCHTTTMTPQQQPAGQREIAQLVTQLRNDEGSQESAAAALRDLAGDDVARRAIAAAGAIAPLVALVANGAAGSQKMAAWTLVRLAYDDDIRTAIAAAGAIAPLARS